jgi:hypothetical protein
MIAVRVHAWIVGPYFMLHKRYSIITYFTRIATEAVGTGTSEDVYSIDTGPTIQACTRTAIINVWKQDQICIILWLSSYFVFSE